MSAFSFSMDKNDGDARTGTLTTALGVIDTPAFMPVGTAGTVKAMLPESVKETGAQIILGNTYHLMLRPGAEEIAALGGLHDFMNWKGPILTDSGGFQVMSLAKLRKIDEQHVTFQSHLDGTEIVLSPERAIEVQYLLGSDISMVLDECPPHPINENEARDSMQLSMRWAERSKKMFKGRTGYGLFGIVQGSVFRTLREESAQLLCEIGFDGYAIGGLAVGEGQETMFSVLDYTIPLLPENKPRYLMGVGKPEDIVGAVMRGVDMFDCVIPTRSGRNARAYTTGGEVNLRNARHAADPRPLETGCSCPACKSYSRAYLHHLFKAGEMLGPMLLTWHNLHYYQKLMRGLRQAIREQALGEFAKTFARQQSMGDISPI